MTRNYLLNAINKAKKDIRLAPQGSLSAVKRDGSVQFYHRENTSDKTGRYISKKSIDLARRLAQKEYAQKIVDRYLK